MQVQINIKITNSFQMNNGSLLMIFLKSVLVIILSSFSICFPMFRISSIRQEKLESFITLLTFLITEIKLPQNYLPVNVFSSLMKKQSMINCVDYFLLKSPFISFLIFMNFSQEISWKSFSGFKLKLRRTLCRMSDEFYPRLLNFFFNRSKIITFPFSFRIYAAVSWSLPTKVVRQYQRQSMVS